MLPSTKKNSRLHAVWFASFNVYPVLGYQSLTLTCLLFPRPASTLPLQKRDLFVLAGDSGIDSLKAGQSRPKRDVWLCKSAVASRGRHKTIEYEFCS